MPKNPDLREISVQAETIGKDGRKKLTLDPIRVIEVPLRIREVASAIPCGFQAVWGEGTNDGEPIEATSGAGFGSKWATIRYKGKDYCFSIEEVIEAFVEKIDAE